MFNFEEVKNIYETLPKKSVDFKNELLNLTTELDGGLCIEISKKSAITGVKIKIDPSVIKELYDFIYNVYFKEDEIKDDTTQHSEQA